jgi:hypothetical protein
MCESYNVGVKHCNINDAAIVTFGNVLWALNEPSPEQFPGIYLHRMIDLMGLPVFNPPIY